ncbi:MAG: Sensor histidine kinase RcsC [Saprospiraceae bacterium]|nr:Sensor histidine kinase RcsC [Saprospiraceae bacterium]
MKSAPATLAFQFHRMELFSTVPLSILEQLAAQCTIVEFPADAVVFHKDEPGHALYLILQGGVKVHDEDYTVARLTGGNCFGELALLDEGPRSMSVTTTVPTALAVIERDLFFNVLGSEPGVVRKIGGMLTQRLRYQTDRVVEELRRREQELTRLVDERTAELMQQKEEAEQLRAKAEAERQEADYQRQRAEQSEQFEQQFLANMSHEIRTPMNAVMGMTNILLRKNPREDQLRYLESIRNSSQALLVILNDILDISKIQAGRMELEHTDFEVSQILEQVASTLRFRAQEKSLTFETICDPAMPPVLVGDPVRLQQILLNLAGNAVKFTEKGGVSIAARLLEREGDTCRLRFQVRDTGIGMTPEQCARAFESFRQASADTTRKYGGTGLGLSISRQLVELFGGALEVQSALGEGSVFSFAIPLKISDKQTLQKDEHVSTQPSESLDGLRILIAEDNEYNRIVAVETLEMMLPGATISTVGNGREAVEQIKTGGFDLVLMDVNMPEMDGLEATRLIRFLPPPLNAFPIIAFTASVTETEVRKCGAAGMNAVVPKPFKESELLEALHHVVPPEVSSRRRRGDIPEHAPDQAPEVSPFRSSKMTPPPSAQQNLSGDVESPDGYAHTGLDFLRQLTGNNRQRIRKYLGLYIASARTSLPKIENALAANKRDELRRAVHTLKPQFKMVGLPQTADLAAAIEARLLDGAEPSALSDDLERLLEDIRRSCDVFDVYLRKS